MTHPTGGRIRRVILAACGTALASLALSGTAMADQPSGGGSFVISDQNAYVGNQVTFWGAQWWNDNPLSTGLAPAAFKGYAETATATCGQDWTTDPGNSSDPPPIIPGMMKVVVSSTITKSGPVIYGDTNEVALVDVDPDYEGDPGHPGTGTVEAILCQVGGGLPS